MPSTNNQPLQLETPVEELYLVGPAIAKRLKKLEITTLRDLLYLLPHRFEDRHPIQTPLDQLLLPAKVTIVGQIKEKQTKYSSRGLSLQIFFITYQNREIEVVFYNQPFLMKTIKKGMKVAFWGELQPYYQSYRLEASGYEIITNRPAIHSLGIIPIYPETRGLTNKMLRRIIIFYLQKITNYLFKEYLPSFILEKEGYPQLPQALFHLHQPSTIAEGEKAKERFLFEEVLAYQIGIQLKKKEWQTKKSLFQNKINTSQIIQEVETASQLVLSPSQKENISQILTDLKKDKPMNRLLLGDVGSGKTLVAAAAAYATFLNGWRTVLMTPTEVLAQQTAKKLRSYLPQTVKVGLHTQSHKEKEDNWQILVGTHALLWRKKLEKVGLIVIDEQHRFGVKQRSKLIEPTTSPHVLTMTATPIPRSLALTLFGHLDLSYLEPLPQKKKQTKTYLLKPHQIEQAYDWLVEKITKNPSERAFIITPLIESSKKETMKDIKAVTELYKQLKQKYSNFPYFGLLHGRMKAKDKETIIHQFQEGKIKILVSTSVVEVGIDIPQADIIIIEGAERFGLAQLHQLRGRVGRLGQPSYCFLIPTKLTTKSLKRLRLLTKISSGHQLAEYDLKLRGPGQVFGLAQHGFPAELLPFLTNLPLLSKAQKYSQLIIPHLEKYPHLQELYLQGKIKDIILN